MVKEICLDTGPITLLYTKEPPPKIIDLFDAIYKHSYHPYIVSSVLVEVFKHLCIGSGKSFAELSLNSFLEKFPHTLVELNRPLMFKAGQLKCRFRDKLSLVDCSVIAYCLINHIELHTTEKNLPDVLNLKIISYEFEEYHK